MPTVVDFFHEETHMKVFDLTKSNKIRIVVKGYARNENASVKLTSDDHPWQPEMEDARVQKDSAGQLYLSIERTPSGAVGVKVPMTVDVVGDTNGPAQKSDPVEYK